MDRDQREQVAAARGAVRDAVSSLQNLHALLRSTKVGPRAISAVLPEMLEGFSPLGDDAALAMAHVAPRLASSETLDALAGYVRGAGAEIAAAVATATAKALDARARLTLEAAIERVAPNLDAARWLIDLVLAAADERPATLDLAELLEEALAPSSQRGASWGPIATVHLVLPARGLCSVVASPRVAIPLMHFAVAHVHAARRGARGATEVVGAFTDRAVIEVNAREGGVDPRTDALVVRAPVIVEPTGAVLRLVAELTDCRVVLPSETHARVEFGPIPA